MAFLLYFTAIVLSGIAAYYSVIGLIAIFSAAAIPVAIMGGSLEAAKLVVASWLYRYWRVIPLLMRGYFITALVILMLITSMGIFGFLSKAHNDQSLVSGDVLAKIAIYDEKIKIAKENIDANRRALKQMDEAVDQTMGRSTTEQGADKAVQIRRSQAKERTRLLQDIEAEQKKITQLNEARAPIAAEVRKVEAEVGPLKYIAALIYDDTADTNTLEKAVRWLIILLIVVFDPLAVLMLIAANLTQIKMSEQKIDPNPPTPPQYPPDDGPLTDDQIEQIKQSAEQPQEKKKEVEQVYLTRPWIDRVPGIRFPIQVYSPPKETELNDKPDQSMADQDSLHLADKESPQQEAPTSDGEIPQPAVGQITTVAEVGELKEQTEKDKSTSKDQNIEQQVQDMIDHGDLENLETVYKKIVKELAKKNKAKSTHWGSGPIRNIKNG